MLERVWLAATVEGVAVHPQGTLTYLLARYDGAPETLSADAREELQDIRRDLRALVPQRRGVDVMVLRLSCVDAPSERSRRRPLGDLMDVAGAAVAHGA